MNGSPMPTDTVFWEELPSTGLTQCIRMREHGGQDTWAFEDYSCGNRVKFICEDS